MSDVDTAMLTCCNVSIRYRMGDVRNVGLKEVLMQRLTGKRSVRDFWADRNVSFVLEKGDMLGIIGTNGAGKSTLLKAVSGIMEPTEGRIVRRGSVVALLELASGFDGDLTVKENAYLRGAMLGYTHGFMDETYENIIDFAELKEFEDRPFRQLSSGMKSRLAFSIASLVNPDILILDEVLSVGDGAFRAKSEAKMREIIKGGATTILVSHSIPQVRSMCNKVLWIEKGKQIVFTEDVNGACDAYGEYMQLRQNGFREFPAKLFAGKIRSKGKKTMRYLNLKPIYGLANRLRTVSAALSLARKYGMRLRVYWFDTPDCHVKWQDILELPVEFDVIEVGADVGKSVAALFSSENSGYFSAGRVKEFLAYCAAGEGMEVSHENFKPFFKGGDYAWLKPSTAVRDEVNSVQKRFTAAPIGVHIRRTDNKVAIFSSPTSLYISKLNVELEKDSEAVFFLATDDDNEKKVLEATFPGRIVTRENVLGRFEDGGIKDALIDLLLLANCKKIYGSFWSSFSAEAAKIGDRELVIVDDGSVALTFIITVEISVSSLRRCLDSLLMQWLFRIEVICTGCEIPESEVVVSEYSVRDGRVRRAPSIADAIKMAKGKYAVLMNSNEVADYGMAKLLFVFAEERGLDIVGYKANRFFGRPYDGELIKKLNAFLDSAYCWKRLNRAMIPRMMAKWMVGFESSRALKTMSVCVRTELLRPCGVWPIGQNDMHRSFSMGVLSKDLGAQPVWSGNRKELTDNLKAERLICSFAYKCFLSLMLTIDGIIKKGGWYK